VFTLEIKTDKRICMKNITSQVQNALLSSSVKEGLITIYVPHTTAAVTINEGADPDVQKDIVSKLNDLIPSNAGYRHMEGNSDSHIKASLIGESVSIPVSDGKMVLGTWQKIFFCEFDGPRRRRYYVNIMKNNPA